MTKEEMKSKENDQINIPSFSPSTPRLLTPMENAKQTTGGMPFDERNVYDIFSVGFGKYPWTLLS